MYTVYEIYFQTSTSHVWGKPYGDFVYICLTSKYCIIKGST